MFDRLSRRQFLKGGAAAGGLAVALGEPDDAIWPFAVDPGELDFPVVDFHALCFEESVPLAKLAEDAAQRGVKLGVLEHAGRNQRLMNDAQLEAFINYLAPYPVYKGIQAEGLDWMRCFSKEVVAKLDYVLSDALTLPEKDGTKRIWTSEIVITDKQDFMDRYLDFNVQVMAQEPIDIMANPTFLPDAIVKEYDALWTDARMRRFIETAKKYNVAIEINSRYNIPGLSFLRAAKDAGVKFSFGSNQHGAEATHLDYSLKMAKELRLTRKDIFEPAPSDKKPILQRPFAA
jgi:histidinol phosphatase-like PHP family hydrolase